MYDADWLPRLRQWRRAPGTSTGSTMPGNVWGLGVTSLLTDISSEMVISILPAYLVLTGGMAPLALGIVTGFHEGGPLVAAWVGGLIADRTGHRKGTAGGGYVISAACRLGWLIVSPGRSVGLITALIVGDRFGKAIRTAPRDALISLSVPPDQRAMAFGLHRALDAAGAALGPVGAFLLLWWLPRRYDVVFFSSFVAALLGVAALALLVEESAPGDASAQSRATRRGAAAFAVFFDPAVRRVVMLAAAFGVVTVSDALLYLLLIQRSQVGPEWIPLLYTGTAIALLSLAVPIGYLADRLGKRRIFILGHLPLLAAYLVALDAAGAWPWNAVLCVALLGTYYACSDGTLVSLASDCLPPDARAVGLAWVATGASIARVCSSILFGLIWTRTNDVSAVATFVAGLITVAVVALWIGDAQRTVTP